jgi:hypothetical protein
VIGPLSIILLEAVLETADARVWETRPVSVEVAHFSAMKWRQHIAAGVSPQISFETHREPRSGGSERHADIAAVASRLVYRMMSFSVG